MLWKEKHCIMCNYEGNGDLNAILGSSGPHSIVFILAAFQLTNNESGVTVVCLPFLLRSLVASCAIDDEETC